MIAKIKIPPVVLSMNLLLKRNDPIYEPAIPPMSTATTIGMIGIISYSPIIILGTILAIELTNINIAPAAEASFADPKPNVIIKGIKQMPPPIPTDPEIKPSKDPKQIISIHF